MTSTELKHITDVVIVALCIWREARGESLEGKHGVASVIANRVASPRWWGKDWVEVVTKPWQFSAMTGKGDSNLIAWPLVRDPVWLDCLTVAELAVTGELPDNTGGAVYYHDITIQRPRAWGESIGLAKKIGRISFYEERT